MSTYTPSPSEAAIRDAIAAEVVEHMSARDVTVTEMAERVGIGAKALANRLETRASFTVEEICRVADVLEVPATELLGVQR